MTTRSKTRPIRAGIMLAVMLALAALPFVAPWPDAVALAQDDSTEDSGTEESEGDTGGDTDGDTEAPAANGDDDAAADSGLTEEEERLADIVDADRQGASGDYEQEEDDDFVPTQEVSSDQSVNFPVDI